MIRPHSIVIADSVIRDAVSNRVSIINVHEAFNASAFPFVLPRFTVFAIIERDQADVEVSMCRVHITLNGETLFDQQVEVSFAGATLSRVVLEFQGFFVPAPGMLQVAVEVAGIRMESYGMRVAPLGIPRPVVVPSS